MTDPRAHSTARASPRARRCPAGAGGDARAPGLRGRVAGLAAAVLLAAAGAGCSSAHYLVNAPQRDSAAPAAGYSLRHLEAVNNTDSLLVVLTLSGGGYRAAALAHAVMALMAETPLSWDGHDTTLLQELDLISAVSGGSLAAAFYAAEPERFVTEFPDRVLATDLQAALVQHTLSPSGLWRQGSKTFGRGDLLQEVLDAHVFQGRRYGDLPRRRPMVYINATDMRHGERFEFTQDQFDHLCSDLDAFPLARAVAASMAVPVLLSPITVWNHAAQCPPGRALVPVPGRAATSRYIHLVDGGLADNTGLSAVLDNVAVHGGLQRTARVSRLVGVRKRVIIVVNAQVNPDQPEDETPHTPGLLRQLRSIVHVPIDRHADASVQMLGKTVRQWQHDLRAAAGPGGRGQPDDFHVIEINLAQARDPALAAALQQVPTGLRIAAADLALIRRFVREEVVQHPEWLRLLRAVTGEPARNTALAAF
ncbi:patatin-like phospholipase family protein [Rubrivivax sp. RP6-9]|uniref:patatin-like phospholipase family protein n=1 Tax=Rubrivivax sp. RP6-9 TaxID=3415750 RepID=UPI003CC69123